MDNSEKQRHKLIQAILNRDPKILGQNDIEIKKEDEVRLFDLINKGLVKNNNIDNIIISIKGPVDSEGVDAVFARIIASNYERRILSYMTGVGFNNYENTLPRSINSFLDKYPNPMDFQSAKDDFLIAIKNSNPIEKYGAYLIAMKDFCHHIFGKKQEYYELSKKLFVEAEEWNLDQDAEKLRDEMLPLAMIDGDTWIQGGQEYRLRPELLDKAGLGPRFRMEVGGVQMALSRVFLVDAHEAAIAYIKFDDKVKVRGYYRSNSQGMWRYFSDYVGGSNATIDWYGVGFNEESLTLPLKIQKQLNTICKRGIFHITGANTAFFLGGTAHRFNSKEEYRQLVAENRMTSDYYKEVNHEPKVNFGVLSTEKHPPESIDIEDGNTPNFHSQLDKYQMETKMYGMVTVRQFASNNDDLRYTIFEIGEGEKRRAWIGGIEMNAPITSTGLKAEWVSTGDICTPLLEYHTMTGGYGNAEGRTDGYEDMWEYIRRTPIIKRFLYTWRDEK